MRTRIARRAAGLGATALLVAALGACGGPAATGGPGPVDRAGVLRVAINTAPPALDPHRTTSAIAQFVYSSLVYDRLTRIGPNLEVRPMLASSWQVSDDRRSVTFRLRDGVTFADGAVLDAAAVKASLDRGLYLPDSTVKAALSTIRSVVVVDPATVRVEAARSAVDIPAVLAGAEGSIISPRALGNPDLDLKPVGSGPYLLESLKLGDSATFVRRDGYWDPDAQQAARIELRFMPENNARTSALRSGQVDLAIAAENQYDQLHDVPGIDFFSYPAAAVVNIRLNSARSHLDDPRVRQALNYAIDRDELNRSLLSGQCDPIGQPLPDIYPGHLATPPVAYTYDPARARQLLAEAGVPDGFEMTMLIGAGTQPFAQLAPAVQAQLAAVGVKVRIVPEAAPAVYSSWSAGGYDGYLIVSPTYATSGLTLAGTFQAQRSYPGPRPAGFDGAMATATDPGSTPEQARDALTAASTVATEQAMNVWICGRHTQFAASERVVGADTMGASFFAGIGDLRYVGLTGNA